MSQNLAQRIGQEFKTLRANELSLKADSSAVDTALSDIDTEIGNIKTDLVTVRSDITSINTALGTKVTTSSAQALKLTGALTKVGNVMHLNKANGTSETIDLSMYLDDTNLARIISGTYNVASRSLVFTRDDGSTFSVDASMFFDDTNLVTSVAGKTGAVALSASDISGLSTVATSGSYNDLANKPAIGNATITVRGTGTLGGTGSFGVNATTNSTIDITHSAVTRTNTTSTASPAAGTTFTAVDGVTTSADGHVTGVNVKTVTLPSAYSLPSGTSTVLGGVKLGSDTVQTVAANAVTATASRSYAVQANSSGQLLVNVPWVDTNTNLVTSVAGKTGDVTLAKADVGLGNVDNTSDSNKPVSTATQTALNGKVDKVTGKQLSTEDFTSAEKTKLAGIPASGAAGDILYHNGTSYVRLPKGTAGQVLTLENGLPVWGIPAIG